MPKLDFADSDALCRYMAEQTDGVCLLSFSGGKDSAGAWLQLRRYFTRIEPVFMYVVPDLEFVEAGVRYWEEFFQTRILRLPHPSLYRMLNALTLQAPENCSIIEDAGLLDFDYDDVFDVAIGVFGLPDDSYTAIGVRAVDSPNRWAVVQQHGPVNEKRRSFYPIFDWRKARLAAELEQAGVRLPEEYRLFGRSFDAFDYRFLKPIKDTYPDDYARILEWFPLAELELKRIEYREAYYGTEAK